MVGSAGQKRVRGDFFDFYKVRFPEESARHAVGLNTHKIEQNSKLLKKHIVLTKKLKKRRKSRKKRQLMLPMHI